MVRPHPTFAALALSVVAVACDSARTLREDPPSCTRCHGDAADATRAGLAQAAPPRSIHGVVDTSDRGVGAHRQHLAGGTIRAAIECRECHVVPSRVEDHAIDPSTPGATVTFGGEYGRAQLPAGVEPRWEPDAPAGPSCSNVYCHGATLSGGQHTSPVWTTVDGSQTQCDSCHGYPPTSHAASSTNCNGCHPGTVGPDNVTIDIAGGLHIDGQKEGPTGSGCTGCHGYPPSDAIHATHANPPSADGAVYGDLHTGAGSSAEKYDFGCGECHPTDETLHHTAAPNAIVDLLPPVPPIAGDSVKRRNGAGAAYDANAHTCTSVYCHSSGQETPVYKPTPDWTSPPAAGLGCSGWCHDNPPTYSGPGTPNSHLFLDSPSMTSGGGWESGHFAGIPGSGHSGSRHGGGEYVLDGGGYYGANQVASPITCQACHYGTVDPAHVLSGRFFYFDTSGNYQLTEEGADSTRVDSNEWKASQCGSCHNGSIAPSATGKVLPNNHVNGVRDVVFDTRTTYTGTRTGLPALGDPSLLAPFYVTTPWAFAAGEKNPDIRYLGSTPEVATFDLSHAAYNQGTKTCSSVACHMLAPSPPVWGGQGYGCATYSAECTWQGCAGCHPGY